MMHGGVGWMHGRFGGRELAKGYKLTPGTVKRALKLTAKYRVTIVLYLLVLIASSFAGVASALILKGLIDNAITSPGEGPQAGSLVLLLTALLLVPMLYYLRSSNRIQAAST